MTARTRNTCAMFNLRLTDVNNPATVGFIRWTIHTAIHWQAIRLNQQTFLTNHFNVQILLLASRLNWQRNG